MMPINAAEEKVATLNFTQQLEDAGIGSLKNKVATPLLGMAVFYAETIARWAEEDTNKTHVQQDDAFCKDIKSLIQNIKDLNHILTEIKTAEK